jgi:hypothetical protein
MMHLAEHALNSDGKISSNLVRDYAKEGMDEMSKKFKDEGAELYKEDYTDESKKVPAAGDD